MDRLSKEQYHEQAHQIKTALADAVLRGQEIPGLHESPTSVLVDAAMARAAFYNPDPARSGSRNAIDEALERFSAELISLMLTYAAGELPPGFDKLPRP